MLSIFFYLSQKFISNTNTKEEMCSKNIWFDVTRGFTENVLAL